MSLEKQAKTYVVDGLEEVNTFLREYNPKYTYRLYARLKDGSIKETALKTHHEWPNFKKFYENIKNQIETVYLTLRDADIFEYNGKTNPDEIIDAIKEDLRNDPTVKESARLYDVNLDDIINKQKWILDKRRLCTGIASGGEAVPGEIRIGLCKSNLETLSVAFHELVHAMQWESKLYANEFEKKWSERIDENVAMMEEIRFRHEHGWDRERIINEIMRYNFDRETAEALYQKGIEKRWIVEGRKLDIGGNNMSVIRYEKGVKANTDELIKGDVVLLKTALGYTELGVIDEVKKGIGGTIKYVVLVENYLKPKELITKEVSEHDVIKAPEDLSAVKERLQNLPKQVGPGTEVTQMGISPTEFGGPGLGKSPSRKIPWWKKLKNSFKKEAEDYDPMHPPWEEKKVPTPPLEEHKQEQILKTPEYAHDVLQRVQREMNEAAKEWKPKKKQKGEDPVKYAERLQKEIDTLVAARDVLTPIFQTYCSKIEGQIPIASFKEFYTAAKESVNLSPISDSSKKKIIDVFEQIRLRVENPVEAEERVAPGTGQGILCSYLAYATFKYNQLIEESLREKETAEWDIPPEKTLEKLDTSERLHLRREITPKMHEMFRTEEEGKEIGKVNNEISFTKKLIEDKVKGGQIDAELETLKSKLVNLKDKLNELENTSFFSFIHPELQMSILQTFERGTFKKAPAEKEIFELYRTKVIPLLRERYKETFAQFDLETQKQLILDTLWEVAPEYLPSGYKPRIRDQKNLIIQFLSENIDEAAQRLYDTYKYFVDSLGSEGALNYVKYNFKNWLHQSAKNIITEQNLSEEEFIEPLRKAIRNKYFEKIKTVKEANLEIIQQLYADAPIADVLARYSKSIDEAANRLNQIYNNYVKLGATDRAKKNYSMWLYNEAKIILNENNLAYEPYIKAFMSTVAKKQKELSTEKGQQLELLSSIVESAYFPNISGNPIWEVQNSDNVGRTFDILNPETTAETLLLPPRFNTSTRPSLLKMLQKRKQRKEMLPREKLYTEAEKPNPSWPSTTWEHDDFGVPGRMTLEMTRNDGFTQDDVHQYMARPRGAGTTFLKMLEKVRSKRNK